MGSHDRLILVKFDGYTPVFHLSKDDWLGTVTCNCFLGGNNVSTGVFKKGSYLLIFRGGTKHSLTTASRLATTSTTGARALDAAVAHYVVLHHARLVVRAPV